MCLPSHVVVVAHRSECWSAHLNITLMNHTPERFVVGNGHTWLVYMLYKLIIPRPCARPPHTLSICINICSIVWSVKPPEHVAPSDGPVPTCCVLIILVLGHYFGHIFHLVQG